MDKKLPYDDKIELAVLGALLTDNSSYVDVADVITEDSFYLEKNRIIYRAITKLFSAGDPFDMLTVSQELIKMKSLKLVGADYVSKVSTSVTSSTSLDYNSRILSQLQMKRNLISASSEIMKDGYDDSSDVFESASKAMDLIHNSVEKAIRNRELSTVEIFKQINAEVDRVQGFKEGEITGVPTGLSELDKCTNGFQGGDLIILAARPGMGKTALMCTIADGAIDRGQEVGIFSLEMPTKQLGARFTSGRTGVDVSKFRSGGFTQEEIMDIQSVPNHYLNRSTGNPMLIIDDTSSINTVELRARIKRMVRKYGVKLVIIDYLQLIRSSEKKNREQEVSAITSMLKATAKEMNIPIIALAQLSRAVEARPDKKPQLSDLRESGSIEQDADLVFFIWRPEYYFRNGDQNFEYVSVGNIERSCKGYAQIDLAKHRHGPTSVIDVGFSSHLTKFHDLNDTNLPWDEDNSTDTHLTRPQDGKRVGFHQDDDDDDNLGEMPRSQEFDW